MIYSESLLIQMYELYVIVYNDILILTEERKDLERVIIDYGGKYSSSLEFATTTHLIAVSPEGSKYDYATMWKKFIVHPQWIRDCIAAYGK